MYNQVVSTPRIPTFVLVTILLLNQCFLSAQRQKRPLESAILLTIDTLRPDHLKSYGYNLIRTPHIDALAAEGARFTTVVAQVPMTLPSHCSILTGTYPMFHKIRDNIGYRLEASKTTLAEILKAKGYQTGAFVGAYVLDSKFGLNQGFDTYYDHFEPWKSKDGTIDPNQLEHRGEEVMSKGRYR